MKDNRTLEERTPLPDKHFQFNSTGDILDIIQKEMVKSNEDLRKKLNSIINKTEEK